MIDCILFYLFLLKSSSQIVTNAAIQVLSEFDWFDACMRS